ncbi:MAG: MBL fold metallo-hydrolase [Candidatus Nanopelagicales bacterium]|nr:MBL fold metallo-hydrolase [Candidatus Nanopelagicales bacterium]MDZ4249067.1 MBL fold metallo-hydrolase [Candidatus Nanopelagicales bacterium]
MTYNGHVRPGGAAAVRELAGIVITKMAVGAMGNNVYLVRDRDTGAQLLIDAAAEPARILDLIGPDGLVGIVTTHSHPDHWQALADVAAATRAVTMSPAADAPLILVPTAVLLRDGDEVEAGSSKLRVIELPGHTPGSIALLYDDPDGYPHVFTGDSLFPGGVGKTWSDEDFRRLLGEVTEHLFDQLPDETWVYPGHGDDTTLGRERPHLGDWSARGW